MYLFWECIIEPPASNSLLLIFIVAKRPPIVFASYKSILRLFLNNSARKWELAAPPIPPPIIAKK